MRNVFASSSVCQTLCFRQNEREEKKCVGLVLPSSVASWKALLIRLVPVCWILVPHWLCSHYLKTLAKWIWKSICWGCWYRIKFAFLLQKALGLRTALTDRLLLLLSLSANAAPYGIFLSLLQRMQGEKPQAKASSSPPKNVGMNMKIKAAILTQVKPCTL